MTKTKQTYKLGKIKQLVDLNQNITNFDLNFTVVSKDGSEFYTVVVDQTMLDNEPNPEYKKVNGRISGNIVADKGVYQNYFLLLKADKPCECDVITEIKEIPKNPEWEKQLNAEQMKSQSHEQSHPPTHPPHQTQMMQMQSHRQGIEEESKGRGPIIVIALIALIGVVLYFYLSKKSENVSQPMAQTGDTASVKSDAPSVERSPSPDYNSYRYGHSREPLFSKFR
jgi:hypothetical protein